MSRRAWQAVVLLAATVTTGHMAGVYVGWSHTIMPGLHATDGRTFVSAFGALNLATYNPLFMLAFTGALVGTAVAALLHLRAGERSRLFWTAGAFVLYLVTVVVTMVVHLPLNDALSVARDAAQESRWVAWNDVRSVASTAAFACLAWALVLHGRAEVSRGRTDRDGAASSSPGRPPGRGAAPSPPAAPGR
ncbi:MAG: DUF1772 domain-containing protein [Pseudonocardia sp.]